MLLEADSFISINQHFTNQQLTKDEDRFVSFSAGLYMFKLFLSFWDRRHFLIYKREGIVLDLLQNFCNWNEMYVYYVLEICF